MFDHRSRPFGIKSAEERTFLDKGVCTLAGDDTFLGQHGVAMMEYGILSGSRTPGELGLWARLGPGPEHITGVDCRKTL